MKYKITKAQKKDIELLIQFKLNTIITSTIDSEEKEKIENYVSTHTHDNYKFYQLILIDDKVIGSYLVLPYQSNSSILDEIYLQKEYRNRGIGTLIIENILSEIKNDLYLWVYKENILAIKLYKSLGFVIKESTDTRYQMVYELPKKEITDPEKLYDFMRDIDYGWVDEENHKHLEVDETYAENYRLQSPNQLIQNKLGVCWDQVELERFYFEQFSLKYNSFFLVYYNDSDCPTHTFIVYEKNNKYYWFEHSWEKYRGIHEYDDFATLKEDIKQKFTRDIKDINLDKLYLFGYEKPRYQLSASEFYEHCE